MRTNPIRLSLTALTALAALTAPALAFGPFFGLAPSDRIDLSAPLRCEAGAAPPPGLPAWMDVSGFHKYSGKAQYPLRAESRPAAAVCGAVLHEGFPSAYYPGGYVATYHKISQWRDAGISTHFVIDRAGQVYYLLDLRCEGHHAEKANARSVGIDLQPQCEGGRCSWTAAQLASMKRLLTWLSANTAIRGDAAHVIGHVEVGKHADPRTFPWADLGIDAAGKRAGGWSGWPCP